MNLLNRFRIRPASMRKRPGVFLVLALCLCSTQDMDAQSMELHPLFHSLGVHVRGAGDADSCTIRYRLDAASDWQLLFPPDRVVIDGAVEYRGSLFPIDSGSTVDIQAGVWRQGAVQYLPVQTARTMTGMGMAENVATRYVAPQGSGTEYSRARPGSIATLFASGGPDCGTAIVLLAGVYAVRDLRLVLRRDCSASTPIVITADSGTVPVVEGGIRLEGGWMRVTGDSMMYGRALPSDAAYTTLCRLGDTLLYPYPSISSEPLMGGRCLSALTFGADGFVRDGQGIWIKTRAGTDPNTSVVTVSTASRFLTVEGNGHDAHLRISGIRFRNFAKPVLMPFGSQVDAIPANVVDIRKTDDVRIEDCTFEYCSTPVGFSDTCSRSVIERCRFRDDAGKWTHAMIKTSQDHAHSLFATIPSSRGRNVEQSGIFMEYGSGNVIRFCRFEGLNSGISSYFDTGSNEECDIYGNVFIDVFDAIECDGYWSNLRIWNNRFKGCMAAISAAPPLTGPRYIYRNVVHGMQGRRNERNDMYFEGCEPAGGSVMMQALMLKTNSGYSGGGAPGNLYVMNNTVHCADTLAFVLTSWRSEWRNAMFVNNLYSHESSVLFHYFDLGDTTVNRGFQLSSKNDDYFVHRDAAPAVRIEREYRMFDCTEVYDVGDVESVMRRISGSPNIHIERPMQKEPMFMDKARGDFRLSSQSPCIDAGSPIQGFSDHRGSAPDIGAEEYDSMNDDADGSSLPDVMTVVPHPADEILRIGVADCDTGFTGTVHDALMRAVRVFASQGPVATIDTSDLPTGTYGVVLRCRAGTRVFRVCIVHGAERP